MSRSDLLPYLLVPGLLVTLGVLATQACGGSDTPEDPRPLCWASHPIPDGGMMRNLSAEEWADLVVRNYREGQASTQNCVGNTIEWRATDDECDVHEDENEPEPQPVEITEENVVVGRAGNVGQSSATRRPVWVITHRFEDGDGFGPVVLTERTAQGIAVKAMGTLRLPTDRARLRLRETGGQQVLVADAERCPPEEDDEDQPANVEPDEGEEGEEEPTCLRYSRLMPVVGDQLATPEVRNREGQCLGPAQVYLSREQTVPIANGWERTFRLAASMEYLGRSIVVHEQVTVEDSDPRDPGRPARLFRTTDGDRVIDLQSRGGMRSEGIPLFERVVRAHGSTQLPIAEAEGNEEQSGSGRGPQARN